MHAALNRLQANHPVTMPAELCHPPQTARTESFSDLAVEDLLFRAAAVADRCAQRASAGDHGRPDGPTPGTFPVEEFRWIAEAGLLAAPLPRYLGGADLSGDDGTMFPLLHLLKQVGRGNLATGRIYEGHVNALGIIRTFGTAEQLVQAAEDARDHHQIFGVWNAEHPQNGLKIQPLDNGRYRLEAGKYFTSGAGHVNRPIVTGRLPDGGWQMCLVPMDQVQSKIDASWWQPLGMESTLSAAIDFSGIELGEECLIGAPGDYYRDPWFNGGSVRFAAVQLGGAEGLFNAARDFLRQTRQVDHAAQRIRAAHIAVALESGNLWLHGAANAWKRPYEEADAITIYAAMMRTAIEEICMNTIRDVERAVGARGLLRPWPFARMIRDLTMYLRQPAPDAVVDRLGRHIIDDPRSLHTIWPDTTLSSAL